MQQTSTQYSRFIPYIVGGLALGAAGYLLYRYLNPAPTLHPQIEANLPIAKDLNTIPDMEGNYDIDGVSFDTEGVIVSSDDNKAARPSLLTP